ncbi:hypothetical protein ACKRZS_003884 [Fusarium odoratissimum]
MEPAFSKAYGFMDTKCWWAATATTERLRQPKNWLYMLYVASNFFNTGPRDMIYGLDGLMSITRGSELLYPDYDKSTVEVHMDSVAAAFVDMQNTDVLLYAPGTSLLFVVMGVQLTTGIASCQTPLLVNRQLLASNDLSSAMESKFYDRSQMQVTHPVSTDRWSDEQVYTST